MHSLVDPKTVFVYGAGNDRPEPKAQSKILTRRDFTVQEGAERQMLLEIYYDPQFYDLELLVESRDASEVRAHMYQAQSNTDISKYKGAKRIQAEIEPGDYTFKVVAKLPGATRETKQLELKYFEFQLYVI